MPNRNQMRNRALELYDEPLAELIPKLMREHKTPYQVGVQLGVYATAVRYWLVAHGWIYSHEEKQWIEPEVEAIVE